MSRTLEIRDPQLAREWLRQGLALATIRPVESRHVSAAIAWCLELAAEQRPIPPMGIVADLGRLLTHDTIEGQSRARRERARFPWMQRYEDLTLGKALADASFERGAGALGRYRGRDRDRAVAFAIEQIRRRADAPGALISPAALRDLASQSAEAVLSQGQESVQSNGPAPELAAMYQEWATAFRQLGECLGAEDVFELEHGVVLLAYGERLTLRQTLALVDRWRRGLPERPPAVSTSRRDVASRMLDEDRYPVGGFSSISNRGTIESLLHSQLAYMEPAGSERPDAFDVKYLRDELLFYARDENQFLRRRRTIALVFPADMRASRATVAGSKRQQSILLVALAATLVRACGDWLGDESLRFVAIFPGVVDEAFAAERRLFGGALQDQIENGAVEIKTCSLSDAMTLCEEAARRSLCQVVVLAPESTAFRPGDCERFALSGGPVPTWAERGSVDEFDPTRLFGAPPGDSPEDRWGALAAEGATLLASGR